MKIESINMMCKPNKPSFMQTPKRKSTDRMATVQDLYEMEERIINSNEKLIRKQNEMIGQTLQSMVKHINSVGTEGAEEEFHEAIDNATLLKLNVL